MCTSPCPGTSALSLFVSNVANSVINIASKISSIGGVGLSLGLAAAKAGVIVEQAVRTSNMINGQLGTMQVGMVSLDEPNPYWILYDGKTVNIYEGNYGDVENSRLVESLAGTSGGVGNQNSGDADVPNKGPVPEGDYNINTSIDPRNRHVDYNKKGEPNQNTGIEQMAKNGKFNAAWGRWRARLEKENVNSTRDNFYFHDSYKGFSHGCIETETRLFYFLLYLHDSHRPNIKVKVKYPNNNSSTNGGTQNKPLTVPSNVVPLYKKNGYPPNSMGNKKYGKLPIPANYTYPVK